MKRGLTNRAAQPQRERVLGGCFSLAGSGGCSGRMVGRIKLVGKGDQDVWPLLLAVALLLLSLLILCVHYGNRG